MNSVTLTMLAKQAALLPRMFENYPEPDNEKVTFPPSPYYRFFKLLAETMRPDLSVELGVCGGGGSLHLCLGGSKQVVGVDVSIDYPDNMYWIKNRYPHFYLLRGDSVELAPIIYDRFGLIDILFIDTTHTYERTMSEYNTYLPYLSNKAVICLDDLFRPGMDKAWADMPDNKLRLDYLHPSQSPTDGGFGVIWR